MSRTVAAPWTPPAAGGGVLIQVMLCLCIFRSTTGEKENSGVRRNMSTSIVNEHLLYLEEHRVVICRTCKHCIRPGGSGHHFRRQHKELERHTRRALKEHCDSLNLANPKDIPLPTPNNCAAIDGLALHTGLRCTISTCGALSLKESTAIQHARSHGWVLNRPETWVICKVQVCRIFRF
jgi:hypothetical protein